MIDPGFFRAAFHRLPGFGGGFCLAVLLAICSGAKASTAPEGTPPASGPCQTALLSLDFGAQVRDQVGVLREDPFLAGGFLFGALESIVEEGHTVPTLADAVAAQIHEAPWQRGLATLYRKMRMYPAPALTDLAMERGLDRGLGVGLAGDPRAALRVRLGLGFLNLPEVEVKWKAQLVSQVVLGRFGTASWTEEASRVVVDAIPAAQRQAFLLALESPEAADHGFVPVFDPISGEWGMREPETGLIWFNSLRAGLDWKEAKEYCRQKGQALPTQNQWETAERHRIREVYPEMKTNFQHLQRQFWSATPTGHSLAFTFAGHLGIHRYTANQRVKFSEYFARCVSAGRRKMFFW